MAIPQLQLEGFQSDRQKRLAKASHRAGITIYPHDNDPVFTQRKSRARYLNWDPRVTEGTVVQLSWSKRLGAPSGSWSAAVKLGRSASIEPMAGDVMDGDWADIVINRNGIPFPLCRGVVDSVRLKTGSAGGATTRMLVLTGRDHGAMFEAIVAWNNIYVQTVGELCFGLNAKRIPGEPGDTPDGMFEKLISATFARGEVEGSWLLDRSDPNSANRSAWNLPPALQTSTGKQIFLEALKIGRSGTRGYFANEQQLWTGAGQSLHQTLTNWCNPLLNEWRYDVGTLRKIGGAYSMAMEANIREKPFVNTADAEFSPFFRDLPTWRIPSWLISDTDLGRSGYERFNIYQLMADMHYYRGQEQLAMTPAIYSREAIRRHGIRPYNETTKYLMAVEGGGLEDERRAWQQLIVDWYAPNPYLLSGTVTIDAMVPEIQIGSRFILDTGDPTTTLQFYVEGVDHGFRWAPSSGGPSSSTTLMLTRGFRGSDKDYLKMVQAISKQYVDKF